MRVLIADDEVVSRRLLEATLTKWGHEVVVAEDGDQAWEVLQSETTPYLAILDWMMPGMDGVSICRALRALCRDMYVYVLLLTARTDRTDLVEAMEAGADDYIAKPFDSSELRVRLRAGERILDLQSALRAAQEDLRIQATHDRLTGLWNRAAVLDALHTELQRARREGVQVAVAIADLDHFKSVNDTYGHQVGDEVLSEAAGRLLQAARCYDTVGRYGGEEFLIVLPGTGHEDAVAAMERHRRSIIGREFATAGGSIAVTMSIGVTVAGGEALDAAAMVHEADMALYAAKSTGRNRVKLWSEVATEAPAAGG
jgi:diguanylate cyclase (GGDEF)-like protein